MSNDISNVVWWLSVQNNQETLRFYLTTLLSCSSVRLCICVFSVCIYSVCLESRKGVTIYATAITCLATPPGTRVGLHDLWCMRYLYVMCVHVSVCEF